MWRKTLTKRSSENMEMQFLGTKAGCARRFKMGQAKNIFPASKMLGDFDVFNI
ncbi:ribonuclease Z [Neisseria sicca]|uniref:ribonuclease Z n=1 Tax=Neisseria sicca TaxID=490 RepID=UPI0021BE6E90|nr:ribonuclease Z [Neisseria sicca]